MGGTPLVAQWWGIHLLMPSTRVQSLVQDDSTCRGATEPMHLSKRSDPSVALKMSFKKHLENPYNALPYP